MTEETKDARRHRPESARHNWQTPEYILELVRLVFGGAIAFDPFTSSSNPTKAWAFCSPNPPLTYVSGMMGMRTEADRWWGPEGYDWPWRYHRSVFANPEYGKNLARFAEHWVRNALVEKAEHSAMEHAIALVPARTETKWWRRMYRASDAVCLWGSETLGSRISFVDPETGKPVKGNDSASSLFYVGDDAEKFAHVFGLHGIVVVR